MRRFLCRFSWIVPAFFLVVGQACAHAALMKSTPADGSVVASAPAEIRLRFNEPVSPVVVRLLDAKGSERRDIHVEARDTVIAIRVPTDLPNGAQVVSYRVVSSDGHPVGGSIVFSVGSASVFRPASQAEIDWAVAPILWLTRLAFYLGLLAGTGGAFFAVWIAPRDTPASTRTVITGIIGFGILAAVLSVGLQGIDAQGAPLAALVSISPWREGAKTSFGLTGAAAILALLCAWGAPRAGRNSRPMALLGLASTGLALALSGHASTAEPQWLMRPTVFTHGVAAAFWVGALIPLAMVIWRKRGGSLPIVRRFSALAVPAVGMMVLAGCVLAIVQIGSAAALTASPYGRVFLGKMAAVALLLALAALNRFRLTPALGTPGGSRILVRSIAAEIILATAILGLVATWRFTAPPRALAAAAEPISVHVHAGQAMVKLTLTPGRAGPVTASIVLTTGDGGPLNPQEVSLTLANERAGIEPIERRAERAPDGTWQVENLVVPLPGRWRVGVDALISDFDKASVEGEVDVRP